MGELVHLKGKTNAYDTNYRKHPNVRSSVNEPGSFHGPYAGKNR